MKPLKPARRLVLVAGTISSGKSTVLDALTGSTFFTVPPAHAGAELELRTKEVPRKGHPTTAFVEVPDISRVVNSMQKTNDACVKRLLSICAQGVSAVLICYPITHVRCEADMQKVMQFLQTLFKRRLPDFGLVFTFCSMLKREELDKAKKGFAAQLQKLCEETFAGRVGNVAYFDDKAAGGGIDSTKKFVLVGERLVKDVIGWADMEKYLDQERKESCEMLLEFADIMEEEKKLSELATGDSKPMQDEESKKKKRPDTMGALDEIEDVPSDVLIKAPNMTKAIRTKTEMLQQAKSARTPAAKKTVAATYEQKEVAKQKEKIRGRFSELTSHGVLSKK